MRTSIPVAVVRLGVCRSLCMGVFLCGLASAAGPAQAQQPPGGAMPPDMQAMMHQAAANQLGILEYCQANGFADAGAVALQRAQIAAMPPVRSPGLSPGLAQAEAAGRRGVVQAGGQDMPLVQAAQANGTSVQALCRQIVQLLREQLGHGQ